MRCLCIQPGKKTCQPGIVCRPGEGRRGWAIWCVVVVFPLAATAALVRAQAPQITIGDVNRVTDQADAAIEWFLGRSRDIRLRFDYADRFLTGDDREQMAQWVRSAGERLAEATETLRGYCRQIEAYEGDDWDRRFGVTGLWRKARDQAERFAWLGCRVDYWQALTLEEGSRNKRLRDIISRCIARPEGLDHPHVRLLHARCLSRLSNEATSRGRARGSLTELLDTYRAEKRPPDATYFHAAINRLDLLDHVTPASIREVLTTLQRTALAEDLEIQLRLAFLELRRTRPRSDYALQEVVQRSASARSFVGQVVLDDWLDRLSRNELTSSYVLSQGSFQRNLALQQACRSESADTLAMLQYLEKALQPPSALLLLAKAQAQQHDDAMAAVESYQRAALAQQRRPEANLQMQPDELAALGARLAWQLYFQDDQHAVAAREALAFYHELAGPGADDELEYAYALVLHATGERTQADHLLEGIRTGAGPYAFAAGVELIIHRLQAEDCDVACRQKARQELEQLLFEPVGETAAQRQARAQAVQVYCRLLLDESDRPAAQKALELLSGTEALEPVVSAALRSEAFRTLQRHPQAAKVLLGVLDPPEAAPIDEVVALLDEASARIEIWQDQPGFHDFLRDLSELGKVASTQAQERDRREVLRLIEAECLALQGDRDSLVRAGKIINGLTQGGWAQRLELVRAQGRLYTAQRDWIRAAGCWQRIATALRDRPDTWAWWRARYWQTWCHAQQPSARGEPVRHAIDVLLSSRPGCPAFWKTRLAALASEH